MTLVHKVLLALLWTGACRVRVTAFTLPITTKGFRINRPRRIQQQQPPPPATGAAVGGTRLGQSQLDRDATRIDNATDAMVVRERTAVNVSSYNTTVTFPSYARLMQLRPGDSVTSEPLTVTSASGTEFDFCVKVYPRGGGHRAQYDVMSSNANGDREGPSNEEGGLTGLLSSPGKGDPLNERVGVYLQYLPRHDQHETSVDATFALRLRGNQAVDSDRRRRFDVEWRAGMRFVPLERTQLARGQANDFGAHLLRTVMLDDLLGITEKDYTDPNFDKPVECQVEVYLHPRPEEAVTGVHTGPPSSEDTNESIISRGLGVMQMQDLRSSISNNDGEPLRVGQVVVPVLRKLQQRPEMFHWGAYPGVEFRILRMVDPMTGADVFYHRPGVAYELKPIYPLVRQLERPWPVRVPEGHIPKLITAAQYNTISAVGSLFTAMTGLVTAFLISQVISVFLIPSRSMEPTLQVGDVLLVEKVTPRLLPQTIQTDQVVLFHPPTALQEIVSRSGGRVSDRDLFVKRVAAGPGDVLSVTAAGDVQINDQTPAGRRDACTAEPLRLIERYITAGDEVVVQPRQVAVLGDCASVSVDSRVWGGLPKQDIVGRPLFRLWPLERFGKIGDLPTTEINQWSD